MKVAVLCEFSGIVRDAFLAQGHDAISCDLEPTEKPGPHIQGDCRNYDWSGYDLVIAHPPCTYLTNVAGAAFKKNPNRIYDRFLAYDFCMHIWFLPVKKMCLENPDRFDGEVIEVGGEATVRDRLPDGFTIEYLGQIVRVDGTHPHLKKREFLSLIAVFHKEGPWLESLDIHIARYRRLKIVISVLPVIGVGFLLIIRYRFDPGRFEFVERA